MFSNLPAIRRTSARLLTIASACGLAASVAPAAQAASAHHGRPVAQMAIAAPSAATVSGPIHFSAKHVGSGVRTVVFSIDGSHRWVARRAPYRYHRTGVLNTRRLRNGTHELTVKAIFAHRQARVAHQRIVVSNAPKRSRTVRQPAGPLNVGVSAPPAGGVAGPTVALFNRETYQYSSAAVAGRRGQSVPGHGAPVRQRLLRPGAASGEPEPEDSALPEHHALAAQRSGRLGHVRRATRARWPTIRIGSCATRTATRS